MKAELCHCGRRLSNPGDTRGFCPVHGSVLIWSFGAPISEPDDTVVGFEADGTPIVEQEEE